MKNINIKRLSENLVALLDNTIINKEMLSVSTQNGNAIILSESDYSSLIETVYLLSSPTIRERIAEAKSTPIEECEEFEW